MAEPKEIVPRYIPNTMPRQALSLSPNQLFQEALETVVRKYPTPKDFGEGELLGIFGGFTGIPYMFLRLSEMYPDLQVQGESLHQLAERYLLEISSTPPTELLKPMCGLINEDMSRKALRACLTRDEVDVDVFLADFKPFFALGKDENTTDKKDHVDTELLQGRAGALYFLRLVRHWVPSCASKIQPFITDMADRLLQANSYGEKSWFWHNGCYTGAVHGDIGNMTQIILSVPDAAPRLEKHLERLLKLQSDQGTWPMFSDRETALELVQFCHGATGFVFSLWAMRPYFPNLHEAIDAAIVKAQDAIWEQGLLTKAPSICHGILGNGL